VLDLRVSFCGLSRGGVCRPPGEEPAGLPTRRRRRRCRPHSEDRRARTHVRGVELWGAGEGVKEWPYSPRLENVLAPAQVRGCQLGCKLRFGG